MERSNRGVRNKIQGCEGSREWCLRISLAPAGRMSFPHVSGLQCAACVCSAPKPALLALPDAASWQVSWRIGGAHGQSSRTFARVRCKTNYLGTRCVSRGSASRQWPRERDETPVSAVADSDFDYHGHG